ncbi:DEAD-domain-containing protein [Gloeopeniophorella convolvens]|nr:DEAD-domain-containing protein [Gloeopeniophorella convolvens]
MVASEKRKSATHSSQPPKKRKTNHIALDKLPWKANTRTHAAGLDFDEGLLELEEVDDVQVVYEETANGRVATFTVNEDANGAPSDNAHSDDERDVTPKNSASPPERIEAHLIPAEKLLPAWHPFSLHPQLYAALHSQQFANPTPIQSRSIPLALSGRDLIGVAETGSGKTLAYGLPILHELITLALSTPREANSRRPLRALILAPTRELALQVSSHLNACLNQYDGTPSTPSDSKTKKGKLKASERGKNQGAAAPRGPPLVSVAAIVGGMSAQKQRRILERGVDVLVATPGRLWDILEEDDELAEDVKSLRYLVLDEADRMIETGHFAELDNILRLTQRKFQQASTDPEFDAEPDKAPEETVPEPAMRTFVFSATLSKDLQQNLKKRRRPKLFKKNDAPASTLDDLLLKLDFRDPEPEVIDISPEGGVVSTLEESRIECLANDKDIYLYYFLLRYPGRTLVFLSSIDGIRRLTPLLELLGLPTFPLHSQLEQRQRLKNLDRFKSSEHAILLATDIAARGLDIPSVSHVVHYQIPRTADTYIHRNGRTARAQRSGFSMLMCAPDERRVVRALMGSLNRPEVTDIAEMNVEHQFLDRLKERIQLAKEIDTAQHRTNKAQHERKWMREAAEAMDIDLDSDFLSENSDENGTKDRQTKTRDAKVAGLKARLKELLKQPLVARGASTRYITSGSRPIAHDILAGKSHEGMIGVRKTEAGADIASHKERKKKGKKKGPKANEAEAEEWSGIGC